MHVNPYNQFTEIQLELLEQINENLVNTPNQNYQQLFNLAKDPLELKNLAEVSENKYKVDELSSLIKLGYLARQFFYIGVCR